MWLSSQKMLLNQTINVICLSSQDSMNENVRKTKNNEKKIMKINKNI